MTSQKSPPFRVWDEWRHFSQSFLVCFFLKVCLVWDRFKMRNYKSYRRSHCVGWSEFHLQWCTKYRYKLFKNNLYNNICAIFLVECSKCYNFKLQEFEIDIDHVHVIVSLPLVMSPSQVVMYLKDFSSKCSVFTISRT